MHPCKAYQYDNIDEPEYLQASSRHPVANPGTTGDAKVGLGLLKNQQHLGLRIVCCNRVSGSNALSVILV